MNGTEHSSCNAKAQVLTNPTPSRDPFCRPTDRVSYLGRWKFSRRMNSHSSKFRVDSSSSEATALVVSSVVSGTGSQDSPWVSTREYLISNLELSWNASWFDKVAPKNKNKIGNYFVKPRRIPRQLQIADQILCRILTGGATSENPEMLNTLCFFPNIPCISLDPKNSSGLEGQGMHISSILVWHHPLVWLLIPQLVESSCETAIG